MTITKNFTKVWLAERSLIFVAETNGAQYVDLYNQGGTKLARYYLNASGKVTIDITDYMRANQSNASMQILPAGASSPSIVQTIVGGRINPDSLIIPANTKMSRWGIVPPSVMLEACGFSTLFEVYPDADGGGYSYQGHDGNVARQNELPADKTAFTLEDEEDGVLFTASYKLKPLQCGKRYASLEWESATGIIRRHTFEVRGLKSAVSATISIQVADGSYDVRKARRDGFSLAIDGLNAYDLWYYSDALLSSSVRVSLDSTNWHAVEITNSSTSLPDGDAEFSKLEMDVNFRNYDAY